MNRLTIITIMIACMVGGLLVGFVAGSTYEFQHHRCWAVRSDKHVVSSPGKRLNKEQRRAIRKRNDYAKRKRSYQPKSS